MKKFLLSFPQTQPCPQKEVRVCRFRSRQARAVAVLPAPAVLREARLGERVLSLCHQSHTPIFTRKHEDKRTLEGKSVFISGDQLYFAHWTPLSDSFADTEIKTPSLGQKTAISDARWPFQSCFLCSCDEELGSWFCCQGRPLLLTWPCSCFACE